MAFLEYNMVERGSGTDYPGYQDLDKTKPNLMTYLDALNKSQPIVQSQYELTWSRWPRTVFFAKNITIPGISVNTIDINHAGFSIAIPTHVTYENTEISMTIIADKEGFHYYDLRNMVIQSGHPLVAGDPRGTIGNQYGVNTDEDIIEVRLRNRPTDETHHHWIIHNFKPKSIGEIELSQEGSSFVEFEFTGTFTHISYDCGKNNTPAQSSSQSESNPDSSQQRPEQPSEQPSEDEIAEQEAMDAREQEEEWIREQEGGEDEVPEGDQDDEKGEGDYSDYTEPPSEDEQPKESAMMSGNEMVITNENGEEISTSSTSQVGLPNPASETDQVMAIVCNDELNAANEEFNKAMEEISKMPPDPNYPPEEVSSEEDTFNTVTSDDGTKAMAGVQVKATMKSAAQKEAYDAAVAKYNEKAGKSLNDYKNYRNTGKIIN